MEDKTSIQFLYNLHTEALVNERWDEAKALEVGMSSIASLSNAVPVFQYKTTRGSTWEEVDLAKFTEVLKWIADGDRLVTRILYLHDGWLNNRNPTGV